MYLFILGLFLILIYFTFKKDKLCLYWVLIIFILLSLIFGLRYNVGIDFKNYEHYFLTNGYANTTKEFFWAILNITIFKLGGDFFIVSLISIIITNVFIYLGIKKRKLNYQGLSIACILFFTNYSIIFLNTIRQGIAVSIFFYATSFLLERNFSKYILFCIIGAMFHFSLLIVCPIFLIFYKSNWLKYINFKIICLNTFLAYLFVAFNIANKLLNIISSYIPYYSKYVNSIFINASSSSILSLGVLMNVLTFLIITYFYTKSNNMSNSDTVLAAIGIIINILSISSYMFDRIGIYFSIHLIVALPFMVENIKLNTYKINLNNLLICIIMVISLMYYSKTVFISKDKLNLEYHHIFETDKI